MRGFGVLGMTVILSAAWAWAPGCDRSGVVSWTVRLPVDVGVDARGIVFEPASAVRSWRVWRGSRVTVLASSSTSRLTMRAPGLCPVELRPESSTREVDARPWIDVGGDRPQVGYGTPFEVDVVAGCEEAARGEVRWKQLEGPPLEELEVGDRGWRLRARTRPLAELRPGPLPWGVVPVSAHEQGRYALEAVWSGQGPELRRAVVVTSIARATGIPTIAIGQRVLLGGVGWHVRSGPRLGLAEVTVDDAAETFSPDVPGHWYLADASGQDLRVSAGTHDHVSLDCGRPECHPKEVAASASSPMTHALERFASAGPALGPSACMLDCHVAGERGLDDGGFLGVARELGYPVADTSWEGLPRALRRLGGVTCSACHGPATIPDVGARASVFSAQVCATCHDSPPAYVHVAEWKTSRMARSDAAPSARAGATCRRCHTTAGFLSSLGVPAVAEAPDQDIPVGVACAACHAPHGDNVGTALVRAVPATGDPSRNAWVAAHPTSGVCVACHVPGESDRLPAASAAAFVIGQVALPDGGTRSATAPHDSVDGGCLGCHGAGKPTQHGFGVDARRCARCHEAGSPERADDRGRSIQDRARALWAAIVPSPCSETRPSNPVPAGEPPPSHCSPGPHSPSPESGEGRGGGLRRGRRVSSLVASAAHGVSPGGPPHASAPLAAPGPMARALYEVALVLEDPAAAAHNAPLARALLDDAERQVAASR